MRIYLSLRCDWPIYVNHLVVIVTMFMSARCHGYQFYKSARIYRFVGQLVVMITVLVYAAICISVFVLVIADTIL